MRQQGELGVEKRQWELTDTSRGRTFYVDVYRPKKWRAGKTPVVLISHGLIPIRVLKCNFQNLSESEIAYLAEYTRLGVLIESYVSERELV